MNTYKAVLRGNSLEWSEEVPERLAQDRPVEVRVTILEPSAGQGQRMAEALERLARLNALSSIADPVAWERQQREDRELPGRDS
ncbi:MAG TPA: hypothetical protein VGW33_11320 [Terriglobia bacterium]|nr:hypothetical protein [Terriglobia bacterium]